MKDIKNYINESSNAQTVKTAKLFLFIRSNQDKCKEFVRKCSKEFIDLGLTTPEKMNKIAIDKKLLNSVNKILSNLSKEIFKSNNLNKICPGLDIELFSVSSAHAFKGITDNDTEDDWAPMYNLKNK